MKEMGWWILDENHTPQYIGYDDERIRNYDTHVWKQVEHTQVGPYRISTVFLGLDHNYSEGPPLLFETMVFCRGSGRELGMNHYASWDQAVLGHAQMVKEIQSWGWTRRWKDEWAALCGRCGLYWRRLKRTLRGNPPGSGSSIPPPTLPKSH